MKQTAGKPDDSHRVSVPAATLSGTDARKKELRKRFAALRASLSPEEKEDADREIASHILSLPAFRNAATVLLYASYGSEPDTSPIATRALQLGKTVAFPRTDPDSRRIAFYAVSSTDELIPGFRGIPEPPPGAPAIAPDEHTFCLVPGYAFDHDGYRLGYGGGYYDRFLSGNGAACFAAGAGYDRLFLAKPLPRGVFDRRVSLIVTEKGVFPTHG